MFRRENNSCARLQKCAKQELNIITRHSAGDLKQTGVGCLSVWQEAFWWDINIPTAKSNGYRNRFICPVMQKSHRLPRAVSEDPCSLINNRPVLMT